MRRSVPAGLTNRSPCLNVCVVPCTIGSLPSSVPPATHTLLARALTLAARDFPFLAGISISSNGDCALSCLPAAFDTRDPGEVADAFAAVLAYFIWLLVIFIGENLGLRKVHEVWPEVPLDRVNPSSGAGK